MHGRSRCSTRETHHNRCRCSSAPQPLSMLPPPAARSCVEHDGRVRVSARQTPGNRKTVTGHDPHYCRATLPISERPLLVRLQLSDVSGALGDASLLSRNETNAVERYNDKRLTRHQPTMPTRRSLIVPARTIPSHNKREKELPRTVKTWCSTLANDRENNMLNTPRPSLELPPCPPLPSLALQTSPVSQRPAQSPCPQGQRPTNNIVSTPLAPSHYTPSCNRNSSRHRRGFTCCSLAVVYHDKHLKITIRPHPLSVPLKKKNTPWLHTPPNSTPLTPPWCCDRNAGNTCALPPPTFPWRTPSPLGCGPPICRFECDP